MPAYFQFAPPGRPEHDAVAARPLRDLCVLLYDSSSICDQLSRLPPIPESARLSQLEHDGSCPGSRGAQHLGRLDWLA